MNPSTALARVLVDELLAQGVRELVLSPGSRSAPLAIAAYDAGRREPGQSSPPLRLHVRIDERTAGFLALGLAKRSRAPVAVITTSGTAVANLQPAVLEAHHAGIPLILLTADRPPELRGVGANQTTDQIKIFGDAVRLFHEIGVPRREIGQVAYWRNLVSRAVIVAIGDRSREPGPVHLNVALSDPLLPSDDENWPDELAGTTGSTRSLSMSRGASYELAPGPRTVVLAGDSAGPDGARLAAAGGWPLLAEPSSGARFGSNAVGPYRLLLERPELGARIERVVLYGTPSLSRPVTRLLARTDVELVIVSGRARWPDPGRRAGLAVEAAAPSGVAPGSDRAGADDWMASWLTAGAAATGAVDSVLDAEAGPTGPLVARVVAASLSPGQLLFAGSSSPIRDLDLAAHPFSDGVDSGTEEVTALANRGLSGIDGTLSSAIGAALAHQSLGGGRAIALLGDLTFLHDANGLLIGPDEPRPDLTIVVVNDDGGGLFHTLEPGAAQHADVFERVFGTPHGADLSALCAATGTPHVRVTTRAELSAALEVSVTGIRVIEVPISRVDRRGQDDRIRLAVEAALDRLQGSTS
jgi:2-succinyl-5-enolpyruvyl-6-hydroxy-3-cyclohexene-1-carboxylate synthase